MKAALERYVSFTVRRPVAVLTTSIALSLLVVAGTLRVRVDLDPEQQLPADHPYVQVDRAIRNQFGGKNSVAIAVLPKAGDIWHHDVLSVVHGITLDVLNVRGVIRQTVASLSSPYVRIPVDRGGMLASTVLMEAVPETEQGISELRGAYEREPLLRGMLSGVDGRAAIIFGDFYDDVPHAAIKQTLDDLAAKYRTGTIDVATTGEPLYYAAIDGLIGQQGYYFAATVAAIALVLALAFRQVQGIVLPCVTALLSTGCAVGFMGLAGIPMNSWTSLAPVVIMTVAAGHSAQMLKRYYEELQRLGSHARAVESSAVKIAPVMAAAGGTAGSSFAALSLLGIPIMTQFGLTTACGIFAAVALEMSFMLALRTLWHSRPIASVERRSASQWIIARLTEVAARHAWSILAVFAGVSAAALAVLPSLEAEFRPRAFLPESTSVGRDLRIFEKHFPSTVSFMVLLEGPQGSMQTPAALRLMADLQRTMVEDPGVGMTSSLADVILRSYQVFADEPEAKALPDDPELVAQIVFLSQSPALERYVDRGYGRSVIVGMLDGADSGVGRRVIARLEAYLATHATGEIRVRLAGGRAGRLLALNDDTVNDKVVSIGMVLAAILIISSILLGSVVGGALVTAPLAMSLIVNLALFAACGVAFDLVGASIAAVGVGMGADYAIYFLYRWQEALQNGEGAEGALAVAMESSGSAVLFVSLAISAGFGVYLVSSFYSLRMLGIFIPSAMLVTSLTTLTLLPAAVLRLRPRFLFGDAAGRVVHAVQGSATANLAPGR